MSWSDSRSPLVVLDERAQFRAVRASSWSDIAPMAMTRMMNARTGTVDVPEDPSRAPDLVSPLVAVLCHRDCPTTGETYVSGMRRVTRLLHVETAGYIHGDLGLTAGDLVAHWDEVFDASAPNPCPDTATWSRSNNRILGLAAPI